MSPAAPETRAHLTLLAAVTGIALVMISGLGLAIHFTLSDRTPVAARTGEGEVIAEVSMRDQIAAAPMLATDPAAAKGGTPALGVLPSISIPQVFETGPEGVPTGYPATAEGAVGQLSQILWSVLGSMNLAHAQRVQTAWFQDPGPAESWPLIGLVQEFLRAGQMSEGLEPGASVRVVPVAGQVKGSDGPNWHVACVLLEITYTYRDQARMAYGHCERMVWDGQRWLIAAGEHPVPAPSTWPGTELAIEAGWRTWVEG